MKNILEVIKSIETNEYNAKSDIEKVFTIISDIDFKTVTFEFEENIYKSLSNIIDLSIIYKGTEIIEMLTHLDLDLINLGVENTIINDEVFNEVFDLILSKKEVDVEKYDPFDLKLDYLFVLLFKSKLYYISKNSENNIINEVIENDDLLRFQEMLGLSVVSYDMMTYQYESLLHMSVMFNAISITEFLLEESNLIYSFNIRNESPLHYVCRYANVEMFKLFLEYNPDLSMLNKTGYNAFDFSVFNKDISLMKYLIKSNYFDTFDRLYNSETPYSINNDNFRGLLELIVNKQISLNKIFDEKDKKMSLGYLIVESGNIEFVEAILETGYDVNSKIYNNVNFLYTAAISDDLAMVDFLIKKGADVNSFINENDSVLTGVARYSSLEMFKYFIEQGANINNYLTGIAMNATYSKNVDIINYLFENEYEIRVFLDNYHSSLLNSIVNNLNEVSVNLITKEFVSAHNKLGVPLLVESVRRNQYKVIQTLVENGADFSIKNSLGETALHVAAGGDDLITLDILIKSATNIDPLMKDNITPLMLAILRNKVANVKMLVEGGASLKIKRLRYVSPLSQAFIGRNRKEIREYLIENGASLKEVLFTFLVSLTILLSLISIVIVSL